MCVQSETSDESERVSVIASTSQEQHIQIVKREKRGQLELKVLQAVVYVEGSNA